MANAALTETTWVGTTTDATLGTNYTFGLPDVASIDFNIGTSTTNSLVGFGAVRAVGTLTGSTNFTQALPDTVTLDSKTYTFKDSPSADGEVDVGTDLETSLDNLFAAINLVTPIGGKYGSSMTIHPTVTAISNTATVLIVRAKDGGTGGNSIVSTVDGSNAGDATWGAGNLASGLATGATMNNVRIEGFVGDMNSSGSLAVIAFNKIYHGGTGTIYIDVQTGNRLIVDSPNYALACHLKLSGDIADAMEFVQGRSTVDWNGLTGALTRVWVDDLFGRSENLSITGTGTVPELLVSGGIITTNGPAITTYDLSGGSATHQGGAIAALDINGRFNLETTDTVTKTYVRTGGVFDLLQDTKIKTATKVYLSPSGEFLRSNARDSFTLFEIGVF